MAPFNPSLFVDASKPTTRAASPPTTELQPLGADLQDAFAAGLRTDRCVAREVSGELGYGCVDWYIYVTESTAAPVVAVRTSNE